jgi:anti-sigma factor RsiW
MPKTVKVRVAVAVDPKGDWNACGSCRMSDVDSMSFATEVVADGEARYWLTADLVVPEISDIPAAVESDT